MIKRWDTDRWASWECDTCVLSGGVWQVESTSTAVGPTHELDSDLIASGLDQLVDIQTQTAVFHCWTVQAATGQETRGKTQRGSG